MVVRLDGDLPGWQGRHGDPGSEYMIPISWRTHYDGYVRSGLAKPDGHGAGVLDPDVDHARHRDDVRYFLRWAPTDVDLSTCGPDDARLAGIERVTSRMTEPSPRPEDLPTHHLMVTRGGPAAREALERVYARAGRVCEVGAVSRSHGGRSAMAGEVIRDIIEYSVGRGAWLFMSIVAEAREALLPLLGEVNLAPMAEPIVLPEDRYRRRTVLVPVVMDPDMIVARVHEAAMRAGDPVLRERLRASTLFLGARLAERYLPAQLRAPREPVRLDVTAGPRVGT